MHSADTLGWGILSVLTAINLAPLVLSLSARWVLLSCPNRAKPWIESLALLRIHNIVLAQVFLSYLFAIFSLIHWNQSPRCGSGLWWGHRCASALAQGCFFSGVLACTCLLCSSDGVGAHPIRRALLIGAGIGALTASSNMLQSLALDRIDCDSDSNDHHSLLLRNLSSSFKSTVVLLSCGAAAVLYLRAALYDQCRRTPFPLLILLALWSILLGVFSVAAETIYWLNDLDTKTEAFTWTGLFHCEHWECFFTVAMWLCACSLQLTIYAAFREDALYWNSLGLSIQGDIGYDIDSEDEFDPEEIAHSALLRQRLAHDLHIFRTSSSRSERLFQTDSSLTSNNTSSHSIRSMSRVGSFSQRLSLLDTIPDVEPGSIARQVGKLNLPFGKLGIGPCIGQGRNSKVFKGTFDSKTVAVKQMSLKRVDPRAIRRINRELLCTWLVSHPTIVGIHGFVVEPPSVLHVLEFCSRGCLANVIFDTKTPRGLEFSIRLALGAAAGVQHLHSFDPPFIHRDIKPNNYLVDQDWNVKLADFGECTKLTNGEEGDQEHDSLHSDLSEVVGTPLFMSPEIWALSSSRSSGEESLSCTEKVDIYSLSVTIWVLASREKPYSHVSKGSSVSQSASPTKLSIPQLRRMVCQGERPVLYRMHWPARLCELLQKGWSKTPGSRPSADDVVLQLEEVWKHDLRLEKQP